MKLRKTILSMFMVCLMTLCTAISVKAEANIFDNQSYVLVNIESKADMTGYNVKTTVDGIEYTSDGRKLFKNGVELIDLSKKGFEDATVGKLLPSLVVTDLTYDKWEGKTIIYIIGTVFKPNYNNFNDTSVYKNQAVKLGTPYMIMMSYIDSEDYSMVEPYKSIMNKCALEGFSPMQEHWGCPYDTTAYDSADTPEGKTFMYAYISNVVHPHMVRSNFYNHTLYILHEELDYTLKDRHIKVYKANMNRDMNTFQTTKSKFDQQFYMTFDYINDNGKASNPAYTQLSLYDTYVFEMKKDRLIVISASNPIQLMFSIDTSQYKNPKMLNVQWKDASKDGN